MWAMPHQTESNVTDSDKRTASGDSVEFTNDDET
jgi:hypothetical protein